MIMRYFILKSVTAVLLALFSLNARAYDAYIDGIYYNLDANKREATVTSGTNKYTGTVMIPSTIIYGGKTYNVTNIGYYAFYKCTGLTSVSIPNSVTSIEDVVFYDCSGLATITVESGNSVYDSRNNCNAIIKKSSNTLIVGCKNTVIPGSVTGIGNEAFNGCSGLISVNIPNSVTWIGSSAFSRCSGLTSVTFGNSVTSIGNNAFDGCSNLTFIAIPNSMITISTGAFENCSITSVTIPNSVKYIDSRAFYNCTDLMAVDIPKSVIRIERDAFSYCSGLTSITIPESVTNIDASAFTGCSGLTAITVESGNSVYDSHNNCNAIIEKASNTLIAGCKNTIIPESVTNIGNYAFYACGLTSIIIPVSVTNIGTYPFARNQSLTSVVSKIEEPFAIGSNAFNNIASTCTLTVPHGTKDAYIAKGWTTNVFKGGIVEAPPIYTKSFRSLVEDAEALVADNHYTTGQTALQAAITTAQNSLAGIVYVKDPDETVAEAMTRLNCEDVYTVMQTLQTAIDEFVFGNDHVDATEKVLNASFDTDANKATSITSWTASNFKQNTRNINYTTNRNKENGDAFSFTKYVENWISISAGNSLAGSGDIHQVVTGLPAGHYRLTADCFAHNQLYSVDCEEAVGIQLYANDVVREIGMTGLNDEQTVAFSVDVDIAQGEDLTIGFRYTDTNVNWLGWDNVTLLYIGDPDTYQNQINAQSNNELSIANAEVGKGGSVVLPVELSNTQSITATQFEVSLPTGVTISKCLLTDRKGDDHTASYKKLANGNYQVTVISLSKEVFSGTSGALLNLTLDVDDEKPTGIYPISLTNIELTTADTKAINPADVSATLTISDVKVADADGNGKVTITDAVAVVDMILSGNASAKVRRDMEDNTLDPQ